MYIYSAAVNAVKITTSNRKSRCEEKNNNTQPFIKRKGTSVERPKSKVKLVFQTEFMLTILLFQNSFYKPSYLKHTGSSSNLKQEKYVSMAEAIINLQNRTPARFRTKPKIFKLKSTIPHSPELATKARSRPMSTLSKDEQEKKEAEEMKK